MAIDDSLERARLHPDVLRNLAKNKQLKKTEAYSEDNPPPYPVTSVNGQTGAVSLNAEGVGALPDTYVPPVTSVNGQTGDVVLDTAESGTDYCKMSDGTLICWGGLPQLRKTATSRGNGGIYTAEWTQTLATFAIPFVSKPIVALTPGGNAYNIVCCAQWSLTEITYLEVGRPNSGSISLHMNYIAIGRWK